MPKLDQKIQDAIDTFSDDEWALIQKKLLLHAAIKVNAIKLIKKL